jgi:16S rRNA (guanine527-N7)-methyltransferase
MERLRQQAGALGLELSVGQVDQLAAHVDLLLRWNTKLNLTRITQPDEVRVKHVLDSLGALAVVPKQVRSVLDLGAGAGFPGIPWCIARAGLTATLVDSGAKKVGFLKSAVAQLHLPARAVQARLEGHPELEGIVPAELVVSRAFAALPDFLKLARPYLTAGGCVVAMLGPRDAEADARRMAEDQGFEVVQFEAFDLPDAFGARTVARLVPRGTPAGG